MTSNIYDPPHFMTITYFSKFYDDFYDFVDSLHNTEGSDTWRNNSIQHGDSNVIYDETRGQVCELKPRHSGASEHEMKKKKKWRRKSGLLASWSLRNDFELVLKSVERIDYFFING